MENLFWLAAVLDLLLFHLPEHSPAPPCLTPRSLRLLCEWFTAHSSGPSPYTATAVADRDRRNICHRSRGAKTLDSTLSPGSGIHTIWLFPSQLLQRWLAWFLSAAALLTLRAKKRWQNRRTYTANLFRWSKQQAVYKDAAAAGIRSQSSWLGALCLCSQFRYSLVV